MQTSIEQFPRSHFNLIVAQRAQAIIDVIATGSSKHFQGTILAVNAHAQTISIDELYPAGFSAQHGQQLIITLRLEGGRRESFSTEVISRDSKTGGYQLRLPETVKYHQRRAEFRIPVQSEWAGESEFFAVGSGRCNARVRDISPKGIRLEGKEGLSIRQGDVLEELNFELLGHRFECSASVRNVRVKGGSGIEIGALFLDLPRPRQRVLERSIMMLQRRHMASSGELAGLES